MYISKPGFAASLDDACHRRRDLDEKTANQTPRRRDVVAGAEARFLAPTDVRQRT
jgi:hypothetical protein